MRVQVISLFLLSCNFYFAFSREFQECEFVQELFNKHSIAADLIYQHLCIGSSLHTNPNRNNSFIGIYGIGSEWWCGKNEAGGICNIKCSDLLDEDIADDVKCANKILSLHGLQGWEKTEEDCRRKYEDIAEECLSELEYDEISQHAAKATTGLPSTTANLTTIISEISIEMHDTEDEDETNQDEEKGFPFFIVLCTIFISIYMMIILTIFIIALVEYRKFKRYRDSRRTQDELETSFEA